MFNGIIYNIGKVEILKKEKSLLIGIKPEIKFSNKDLGSSISCNGVCLTLSKIEKNIIFLHFTKQ